MNTLVVGTYEFEDAFANHIYKTIKFNVYKLDVASSIEKFVIRYISGSSIIKIINRFSQLFNITGGKVSYKKISNLIKFHEIDLIIVTHDYIDPIQFKLIRSNYPKVIIVLWFPDHIANFGKAFFLLCDYDYFFFKDHYVVKKLNALLGNRVKYLAECFFDNGYVPTFNDNKDYDCDVLCIGNFHPWRVLFYESIKRLQNLNMKFYGMGPPIWIKGFFLNDIYCNRPLFGINKNAAFNNSKICLNNLFYGEINGVNVRTFEICGSGGFQLINESDAVAELFKIGEEIVTFSDQNDLLEKIDYYMKNDSLRIAIARAGFNRAMKDHKYENRIDEIFKLVSSNIKLSGGKC